jgi:hypothetical protein
MKPQNVGGNTIAERKRSKFILLKFDFQIIFLLLAERKV